MRHRLYLFRDTYCSWLIDSGGADKIVYLWFAIYNIEPFYDYINIYDGMYTQLARLLKIKSYHLYELSFSPETSTSM